MLDTNATLGTFSASQISGRLSQIIPILLENETEEIFQRI